MDLFDRINKLKEEARRFNEFTKEILEINKENDLLAKEIEKKKKKSIEERKASKARKASKIRKQEKLRKKIKKRLICLARKAKTQRTEDETSLKQLEKAPLSLKKIKIMQEKRRPIV